MPEFTFTQTLGQLDKRKGGYYYLRIDKSIVDQYEKKRATRLQCTLDDEVTYSCGLNPMGDGHFFLIVATRYLKKLKKEAGDTVRFHIVEDPNPLGVEVPEVLTVLLEQDAAAKAIYERMTDGKKRSLIHILGGVKGIDGKVQKALTFLRKEEMKLKR